MWAHLTAGVVRSVFSEDLIDRHNAVRGAQDGAPISPKWKKTWKKKIQTKNVNNSTV